MNAVIVHNSKHCWHEWTIGDRHRFPASTTSKQIQSMVGTWRRRHPEFSHWRWSCQTVGNVMFVTRVK